MTSQRAMLALCVALLVVAHLVGGKTLAPATGGSSPDMGSTFKTVFSCFPSDQSSSTCAANAADNGNAISNCVQDKIAALGLSPGTSDFVYMLVAAKFKRINSQCQSQYCFSPMNDCFGDIIRTSLYQDQNTKLMCNAEKTGIFDQCWATVASTCSATTVTDMYKSLIAVMCSSNTDDANYLLALAACYPHGAIDVGTGDTKTMCGDYATKVNCKNTAASASVSDAAKAVAAAISARYSFNCDSSISCDVDTATCLDPVFASWKPNVPESIYQDMLCSSVINITSCLHTSSCTPDMYQQLLAYLSANCDADACNSGVQSCYEMHKYIPPPHVTGAEVADGWCNANAAMSSCLKIFAATCQGSTNPSTELAANMQTICDNRADNGCYGAALACLYNLMPTLSVPAQLWNTDTANAICLNFDQTETCLSNAVSSCTQGSQYQQVSQELTTIIINECGSQCSDSRKQACSNLMQEALVHIWTDPYQASCSSSIVSENCYGYIAKKCTQADQTVIDLKVSTIGAIVVAITAGCQNSTTVTLVPTKECHMADISVLVESLLRVTYENENLGVNNTDFCSYWDMTHKTLLNLISNCNGEIQVAMLRTVTQINLAMTSTCTPNPDCHLAAATVCVRQFTDNINAADSYMPPKDYMGRDRPENCRHVNGGAMDSGELSPPRNCYDYAFQWSYLCVARNKTKDCISQQTSTCDSSVKQQLDLAVDYKMDNYNEYCALHGPECQVDQGQMCLEMLIEVTVMYGSMSSVEQAAACDQILYYICVFGTVLFAAPRTFPTTFGDQWRPLSMPSVVDGPQRNRTPTPQNHPPTSPSPPPAPLASHHPLPAQPALPKDPPRRPRRPCRPPQCPLLPSLLVRRPPRSNPVATIR
jgi:hypothetical protein